MSGHAIIAVFEQEDDFRGAVRAAREKGLAIIDAYSPYAVHGMDDAMGLQPSQIPWITFVLGLLGAAAMLWFQFWGSAVDWPINIGGKPWNSLPAFVPVKFEVIVLFSGVGTVLFFLAIRNLLPGRKNYLPVPETLDDRFAVMIEVQDSSFDLERARDFFSPFNAVSTETRIIEGSVPR